MIQEVIASLTDPATILALVAGVLLGIVIGALPGLSATMAIALVIPVTYAMDTVPGLVLLVSVYTAGIYGGAISAILIRTPGTPSNAATTLDGYPLTLQGKGLTGIVLSSVGSVVGGVVSGIALILFAPLLGRVSLAFGPHEFFWIALFGLTIIGGLAGSAVLKGIIAALFGLAVSFIGIDQMSGNSRMTFGQVELQSGVQMVPAMIGLFAISQIIVLLREDKSDAAAIPKQSTSLREAFLTVKRWIRLAPTLIKSTFIGIGVGLLPGAGGDVASWVSYNEAKRSSRDKKEFGKGKYEGVIAPETASNAVTGGALIPTLTLGIPGSTAAAILLGGFIMKGMNPGHELFTVNGVETYSILTAFIVASVLMGIAGIGLARYVVKVADLPKGILVSVVTVLAFLGAYSIRLSLFDVWLMLVFGLIGFALHAMRISPAPVILGLILGPIAERGYRQAVTISGDSVWIDFLQRPLSLALMALIVLVLLGPLTRKLLVKKKTSAKV